MPVVRGNALLNLLLIGICVFTSVLHAQQYNRTLDCDDGATITSPAFPKNYHNNANIEWNILALPNRRILVRFKYFEVEEHLDMVTMVDPLNTLNNNGYTGAKTDLPPYLSQGNRLTILFTSSRTGRRRGFNLTISCYKQASSAMQVRLVNSDHPEEGLVELSRMGGKWTRVCKDDFDEGFALVICRQLGYPEVERIDFENGACAGKSCVKAPQFRGKTYLLDDFFVSYEECQYHNGLRVQCHKPGYVGCYELQANALNDEFSSESISDCVSSCQSVNPDAIAAIRGEKCFCTSATTVNLTDLATSKDKCDRPENNTQLWRRVYTTSSGFCDPLEISHGTVEPNITWFGSIVSISCDGGYSLTGASRLQCGPGNSTYHPVWDESKPNCTEIPGFVSTEDSVKTYSTHSPGLVGEDLYSTILVPIIIISSSSSSIIIIIILAIKYTPYHVKMKLPIIRSTTTGRRGDSNDRLSRGPDIDDTRSRESGIAARTGSIRGQGSAVLARSPYIGDVLSSRDARHPTLIQLPSHIQPHLPRGLTLLIDTALQCTSASRENPYYILDDD